MKTKWEEIEDVGGDGTKSFVMKTVTGWVLRTMMLRYHGGSAVSVHMVVIDDPNHATEFQFKDNKQS